MRFLKSIYIEGIAHAALLGLVALEWTVFFIKKLLDKNYFQYMLLVVDSLDAKIEVKNLWVIAEFSSFTLLILITYVGVLLFALVLINCVWKILGLKQLFE